MKMTARAWSKWTGYLHTLRQAEIGEKDITGTEDGGVEISAKISNVALSGTFKLSMSLTPTEVQAITKKATTGALQKRVADLEKKLASLA